MTRQCRKCFEEQWWTDPVVLTIVVVGLILLGGVRLSCSCSSTESSKLIGPTAPEEEAK